MTNSEVKKTPKMITKPVLASSAKLVQLLKRDMAKQAMVDQVKEAGGWWLVEWPRFCVPYYFNSDAWITRVGDTLEDAMKHPMDRSSYYFPDTLRQWWKDKNLVIMIANGSSRCAALRKKGTLPRLIK